jgi:solute carrier family 25 (mitochondrial carnitine/acylcarnitine transporter), member 20/29
VVTAVRDAVGYGFYFCAYDAAKQALGGSRSFDENKEAPGLSAWKILLAGGVAGCVSWASIFPLDVVKTRVQGVVSEAMDGRERAGGGQMPQERTPLLEGERRRGSPAGSIAGSERSKMAARGTQSPSTIGVAIAAYQEGGLRIFFRGLGICSIRAFVVNAVQWAVYEWVMELLLHRHKAKSMVSV